MRWVLMVLLSMLALPARAQTVWDMATEYSQTSMSGIGITEFAARVSENSGGTLIVKPSFDGEAGLRSSAIPAAVARDRIQAGDAFAGALDGQDPLFALFSLPFLTPSPAQARRLMEIARPYVERSLAGRGLHLLYVTPWPPTGIWSKKPLNGPEDLTGLAVRTYDLTSSIVLSGAGANAIVLSLNEAMAGLRDGSVNGMLSSAEGGDERRLWRDLTHYTEVGYILPLSLAVVNARDYAALSPDLRAAVDQAARETQTALWPALDQRMAQNYRTMADNGITVAPTPAPALEAALRKAALATQESWCSKVGKICHAILDPFRAAQPQAAPPAAAAAAAAAPGK